MSNPWSKVKSGDFILVAAMKPLRFMHQKVVYREETETAPFDLKGADIIILTAEAEPKGWLSRRDYVKGRTEPRNLEELTIRCRFASRFRRIKPNSSLISPAKDRVL